MREFLEGVGRTIGGVRRQAPAARMVGQFAVKMLVKEAGRLTSSVLAAASRVSPPSGSGTRESTDSVNGSPWPPPEPTE